MIKDFFSKSLLKYAIVGALSNILAYCLYLALTYFELSPQSAISILYPAAVIISYSGHKKYSFSHTGEHIKTVIKFLIVHLIGYLISIQMQNYFHDQLQIPHQYVQVVVIITVAFFLYVNFNYFVFNKKDEH
jgi:putative flippase GtrA